MKPTRRKVSMLSIVVLALVNATARAQSPTAPAARSSPEWGTTDQIWYHVGYSEFSPLNSSVTYSNGVGRFSTVVSGAFVAALHLPSGVLLTRLELTYCDSTVAAVVIFLQRCAYLGGNCQAYGILNSNTGMLGCQLIGTDLTPQNIVIDNNSYFYEIFGVTGSGNSDTQIVGAYVGYKLQVSPAPASATFADVPTGHQQFRFVEALFAAGITAGCGGGNFCPDAPITRGQMAVFLSAALGLHFPN